MRSTRHYVVAVVSVCAGIVGTLPAAAQALSKHQADVILDNSNLGDDLARKDAAARRAKYQGDSPFAEGSADDARFDHGDSDESVVDPKHESRFRPLALTLNPITLVLARFGANIEYLPARHHGIMLNPYFSSVSAEAPGIETSYESFGAELGYHFYTGKRGANGFFVGPSFVFTHTRMSTECLEAGCRNDADVGFTTYGVALDLGGQHVFDNGVTLGAGGGLMYLKSSTTADGGRALKFEGTLPRILFTVGYSI